MFSQAGWDIQDGMIGNCFFKKRGNLDAGKFSYGNRVCDEWNKLAGCVVNMESMNEFKRNLDHYIRDNRG